jgi:excisionase family DNA binding protein
MPDTIRVRNSRVEAPAISPLLLSVQDTSRLLGIGRSQIYKLLASGELPSVKVGRLRRIPSHALHKWIERRMQNQGAYSGHQRETSHA